MHRPSLVGGGGAAGLGGAQGGWRLVTAGAQQARQNKVVSICLPHWRDWQGLEVAVDLERRGVDPNWRDPRPERF
jgi:hypothetical protein